LLLQHLTDAENFKDVTSSRALVKGVMEIAGWINNATVPE
jgi:hypothetical protein